MTDMLIFDACDKNSSKNIVFYTAHAGMVLPLVHFSPDSAIMPSLSNLFTIRHRCFQDAWPADRTDHLHEPHPALQAGGHSRI